MLHACVHIVFAWYSAELETFNIPPLLEIECPVWAPFPFDNTALDSGAICGQPNSTFNSCALGRLCCTADNIGPGYCINVRPQATNENSYRKSGEMDTIFQNNLYNSCPEEAPFAVVDSRYGHDDFAYACAPYRQKLTVPETFSERPYTNYSGLTDTMFHAQMAFMMYRPLLGHALSNRARPVPQPGQNGLPDWGQATARNDVSIANDYAYFLNIGQTFAFTQTPRNANNFKIALNVQTSNGKKYMPYFNDYPAASPDPTVAQRLQQAQANLAAGTMWPTLQFQSQNLSLWDAQTANKFNVNWRKGYEQQCGIDKMATIKLTENDVEIEEDMSGVNTLLKSTCDDSSTPNYGTLTLTVDGDSLNNGFRFAYDHFNNISQLVTVNAPNFDWSGYDRYMEFDWKPQTLAYTMSSPFEVYTDTRNPSAIMTTLHTTDGEFKDFCNYHVLASAQQMHDLAFDTQNILNKVLFNGATQNTVTEKTYAQILKVLHQNDEAQNNVLVTHFEVENDTSEGTCNSTIKLPSACSYNITLPSYSTLFLAKVFTSNVTIYDNSTSTPLLEILHDTNQPDFQSTQNLLAIGRYVYAQLFPDLLSNPPQVQTIPFHTLTDQNFKMAYASVRINSKQYSTSDFDFAIVINAADLLPDFSIKTHIPIPSAVWWPTLPNQQVWAKFGIFHGKKTLNNLCTISTSLQPPKNALNASEAQPSDHYVNLAPWLDTMRPANNEDNVYPPPPKQSSCSARAGNMYTDCKKTDGTCTGNLADNVQNFASCCESRPVGNFGDMFLHNTDDDVCPNKDKDRSQFNEWRESGGSTQDSNNFVMQYFNGPMLAPQCLDEKVGAICNANGASPVYSAPKLPVRYPANPQSKRLKCSNVHWGYPQPMILDASESLGMQQPGVSNEPSVQPTIWEAYAQSEYGVVHSGIGIAGIFMDEARIASNYTLNSGQTVVAGSCCGGEGSTDPGSNNGFFGGWQATDIYEIGLEQLLKLEHSCFSATPTSTYGATNRMDVPPLRAQGLKRDVFAVPCNENGMGSEYSAKRDKCKVVTKELNDPGPDPIERTTPLLAEQRYIMLNNTGGKFENPCIKAAKMNPLDTACPVVHTETWKDDDGNVHEVSEREETFNLGYNPVLPDPWPHNVEGPLPYDDNTWFFMPDDGRQSLMKQWNGGYTHFNNFNFGPWRVRNIHPCNLAFMKWRQKQGTGDNIWSTSTIGGINGAVSYDAGEPNMPISMVRHMQSLEVNKDDADNPSNKPANQIRATWQMTFGPWCAAPMTSLTLGDQGVLGLRVAGVGFNNPEGYTAEQDTEIPEGTATGAKTINCWTGGTNNCQPTLNDGGCRLDSPSWADNCFALAKYMTSPRYIDITPKMLNIRIPNIPQMWCTVVDNNPSWTTNIKCVPYLFCKATTLGDRAFCANSNDVDLQSMLRQSGCCASTSSLSFKEDIVVQHSEPHVSATTFAPTPAPSVKQTDSPYRAWTIALGVVCGLLLCILACLCYARRKHMVRVRPLNGQYELSSRNHRVAQTPRPKLIF